MTSRSESEPEPGPGQQPPPRQRATLWLLILGPTLWMLYFLVSYITGAIWCAKIAGRDGSLAGARIAIGVYTVLTLIAIGAVIWRGARKAGFRTAAVTRDFDFDSAGEQYRFLGFATVLLGGLSAVATVYVGLPIIIIGTCS